MITRFNKFENPKIKNISESVESDLADHVDDEYIEDWFDNIYDDRDVEDILDLWPTLIFDHIDDERYIEDYKDGEKQSLTIDEYDEYEFKPFIIEKIDSNNDTEKEATIVKIYRKKEKIKKDIKSEIGGVVSIAAGYTSITITNDKESKTYTVPDEHDHFVNAGDEVSKGEKITKLFYNDDMLDKLDAEEMKKIITDDNEEEEFINDLVDSRYDEYTTAKDIVDDMYGNVDQLSGKELNQWFYNYLDDDALIAAYKDGEELDHKKDMFGENIYCNTDIQEKILEEEPSSVLELAKLFSDGNSSETIEGYYDFQKIYIEQYIKVNEDDDDKPTLIAQALYNLFVEYKFEKDINIMDEFSEYMYMVDGDTFKI